MLTAKRTSKEYQKWLECYVHSFISEEKVEWQSRENYLDHNGLFITVTFDQKVMRGRQSDLNDSEGPPSSKTLSSHPYEQSKMFQTFGQLFKNSLKHVIGSNYQRKRERQPCAIACGDVNGTRYGSPETAENPHIHSLWVFRKGEKRLYQEYLENKALSQIRAVDHIDVQELTNMEASSGTGNKLFSYMTKYMGTNTHKMILVEDFMIYPTPKKT